LGSEGFKTQLLEEMEGKLGQHHSGELRRETMEAKAGRVIAEELGRLGWKEADLLPRRKSDPAKLGIAARLRRERTLPSKAIARRVHLGTSRSPNIRLHAAVRAMAPAADPAQGRLGIWKKAHHVMGDPFSLWNRQNLRVDGRVLLLHHPPVMDAARNQFSPTRVASKPAAPVSKKRPSLNNE